MLRLLVLCLALTMPAFAAGETHCRAELVAASTAIAPGQPLMAAVVLHPDPGWHTYWRNPGDAGQATELTWKLPAGFKAGTIEWPTPESIEVGGIVSYGYNGEAVLLVPITAPAHWSGPVTLRVHASWLVCSHEACLPGQADLSLVLSAGAAKPSAAAALIEKTRDALPHGDAPAGLACHRVGGQLRLALGSASSPHFYPYDSLVVDDSAPQTVDPSTGTLVMKAAQSQKPPTRLAGVLVFSPSGGGARRGVPVDIPIEGTIKRRKTMKRYALGCLLVLACTAGPALADASVGAPAPDFTAKTTTGSQVHLADYKGKYVVLEWVNSGCPFVQKVYHGGKMQAVQKKWKANGVVWLSVCSSAPGKQGNSGPSDLTGFLSSQQAQPDASIVDADGGLGHLYGARTTPDMFIVDPSGKLIYSGAIDDQASDNYVDDALSQATKGNAVSVTTTKSYGCSVKYAER